MATRTTPWPPGTPCWTDNHVPDLAVARAYYGAVLGWTIDDPDPGAGNFAAARCDGRPVAGFLVAVEGAQPGWHVFLASADADETAAAIEQHGGTSLFGPHPVPPDLGRFQLAADPGGAVFGVWEAGSLLGTAVFGEPGALGWEDLRSSDPAGSQAFYAAVFGVTVSPFAPAGPDYALFHLPAAPDAPLGGMGGLAGAPAGTQSHWVPYYVVADVDAALAASTAQGGRVTGERRDTPYGPMGGVEDPFGAGFWVVTPANEAPDR